MRRIEMKRYLTLFTMLVATGLFGLIPTRAQAPSSVTVQGARKVPISEDPDDPNASREERIRRSREQISRAIQMKQRQQAEANQRGANQAAGRVQPPPPPKPAGKEPDKTVDITKSSQRHVSLYMTPAAQSVMVGETFSTQWQMLNMNGLPITTIVIAMSYPPDILKPVAVHQDTLKPLIKGHPEFDVDPAAGRLVYRAEFAETFSSSDLELLTIVWEALAPAQQAHIQPSVGDAATTMLNNGISLTKTMIGLPDAVNGADVQVRARPSTVPSGNRIITPDLRDLQPVLAGFADQSQLRPPTLWINQPEQGELAAGQWVVVDIGLDNPDKMVFDELRLALKFDPEAVEVIDADENNSIHHGVNILDGPFRSHWYWTQHYENAVDNGRGTVFYRVGTMDLMEQPSGTVTRIFARLRRPAKAPIFSWIWEPDGRRVTTGVYLLSDNIYLRDLGGGDIKQIGNVLVRTQRSLTHLAQKPDPALYRDQPEESAQPAEGEAAP